VTRFADRTVLVTGGSRGLGRAIATAFAAEGARVWVGYATRADEAERTVRAIADAGGSALAIRVDVTDGASLDAAVARVVAEHERIDVLVNAAGVVRDSVFALSSPDDWDDPLRVNLGGALRAARAVVLPMLAARRGAIVFVGSISGVRASPGQAAYSAAKGGLVALTRTLGAELAPRGIRVNSVVPGLCAAGMAQRLDRRVFDDHVARTPLGRAGTAEEIAAAVLFVASDAASFVVGQSIVVDGGLSL
jgi:3-oxoacyl-[acyl-carrier protein] reductase